MTATILDTSAEEALRRGHAIATAIEDHADEIREILGGIASDASIRAEIADAAGLLRTADIEAERYLATGTDTRVRVYLPSNNALYSLALFVLLPSLFLDDVMARPSTRSKTQYRQLMDVLGSHVRSSARLVDRTQREFADLSAGCVVVFNGRPDNGRKLAREIGQCHFLGFGAGPNPVFIGPELTEDDIAASASTVASVRMYNNGEDCLCPDLIFVHTAVRKRFRDALVAAIEAIPATADRHAAGLVNGPLSSEGARSQVDRQIHSAPGQLVWRGTGADHPAQCPAAIFEGQIADLGGTLPEYFGPVFNVVEYQHFQQAETYLLSPGRLRDGMYVWGYGEPRLIGRERVGTARHIGATTPFDAESGHEPFGGWGPDASWSMRAAGTPVGRPLLLSDELARRPR
ncbi:aldehyde dehydrogenase [Rhodococcus sp. ABRD24]|uniref:aldehyde dehydrogenase family protein n=1 Tax=Rhodococcus sp. ABRD24 TaxID=2507582 RepID=UPI001040CDD1|nr:aldehyde dehydrogenase family protein [Rhodococcus sp. ABRD24]QBJ98008.1 aldehyde dehydrogenase [Rhodococcus sp. ABRD24]